MWVRYIRGWKYLIFKLRYKVCGKIVIDRSRGFGFSFLKMVGDLGGREGGSWLCSWVGRLFGRLGFVLVYLVLWGRVMNRYRLLYNYILSIEFDIWGIWTVFVGLFFLFFSCDVGFIVLDFGWGLLFLEICFFLLFLLFFLFLVMFFSFDSDDILDWFLMLSWVMVLW